MRTNPSSQPALWTGFRALALAAALPGLFACASSTPAGPIGGEPAPESVAVVTADWDDLEAAAVLAASKTESVVVAVSERTTGEMVFELVSIRDEPVVVTARRPGTPRPGPEPIELTCTVGRLGDATLQARFLDAMSRRLTDLSGVDYRKVR